MPLDHLSFATTPVVALRDEKPLWQGSGFFYLHQKEDIKVLYLVTNYHVIAGRAPEDPAGPVADHIVFQFHLDADVPGSVRPVRVPLFSRGGQRVWLQSESVPAADLVAIPVPAHICEGCRINCLDRNWMADLDGDLSPIAPIHVVGFPYGYHDRENALPLWQTGALASEPSVDVDGQPMVLVDMPTYPGMSGAPAFALASREQRLPGQNHLQPGAFRRFIGMYASLPVTDDGQFPEAFCSAGRAGLVARDAGNWGRIWRARLIEELVSSVDTERWEREVLADLA